MSKNISYIFLLIAVVLISAYALNNSSVAGLASVIGMDNDEYYALQNEIVQIPFTIERTDDVNCSDYFMVRVEPVGGDFSTSINVIHPYRGYISEGEVISDVMRFKAPHKIESGELLISYVANDEDGNLVTLAQKIITLHVVDVLPKPASGKVLINTNVQEVDVVYDYNRKSTGITKTATFDDVLADVDYEFIAMKEGYKANSINVNVQDGERKTYTATLEEIKEFSDEESCELSVKVVNANDSKINDATIFVHGNEEMSDGFNIFTIPKNEDVKLVVIHNDYPLVVGNYNFEADDTLIIKLGAETINTVEDTETPIEQINEVPVQKVAVNDFTDFTETNDTPILILGIILLLVGGYMFLKED